jgi:hypothetical protein
MKHANIMCPLMGWDHMQNHLYTVLAKNVQHECIHEYAIKQTQIMTQSIKQLAWALKKM